MSEHHYHLVIKDLPEEYSEKYPDFVRIATKITNPIEVQFIEPSTLSLCGVSAENYANEINLENIVEFLLSEVCGSVYGYPTPEKSELLRYCALEEKPDSEKPSVC